MLIAAASQRQAETAGLDCYRPSSTFTTKTLDW